MLSASLRDFARRYVGSLVVAGVGLLVMILSLVLMAFMVQYGETAFMIGLGLVTCSCFLIAIQNK